MSRSIDQTVAGKYDKRADVPLQRSRIANLRKVNNYVKAALLAIFTEHPSSRRNDGHQTSILQQALWPCLHMVPNQPAVVLPEFSCNSILDLCCGRGGDLPKYAHSDARRVVIADVSQISVEEAISRYNEMKPRPQYEMLAIHADCTVPGLITDSSLGKGTFDIVACQFALHYACSSPQCLEGLLSNVSDALHPGGVFIGTTLDSNEIVRRLKATSSGFELASCNATLQNSLFKLTYMSNGAVTVFGMKYLFQCGERQRKVPNSTRSARNTRSSATSR